MQLAPTSNLSDMFYNRVQETPDRPAFRQFDGTNWITLTWKDTARNVARWQAGLKRDGLQKGDRIAMCMRNRVEWVQIDQAAIGLGLVTVPLYFDDRPENMAFCMNDAGVRFLMLEDGAQWTALKDHVKTIERVVCLGGTIPNDPRVQKLSDWAPTGDHELIRSGAGPQELSTICYTSGTTGRPKGVMLSHRNIVSNTLASAKQVDMTVHDLGISFLPMSHMFERTCGYYLRVYTGAEAVFARSITTLGEDLLLHKPTAMVSVPRVFERVWGAMQQAMPVGDPKRKLFDKTVEIGWRRFKGEASLKDHLLWPILKALVAKKVHARLGGRVRILSVGGAAFPPALAKIFLGLGFPILQGYGLTETAPVLTSNRADDNDPLSVGRAVEGVTLRLAENGELLAKGPNLMLGYWNNPEATKAAIDADGWFHTGDVAAIRDGRVYITGRIKDVIVMSNGEKLPPDDAEQALARDPIFEHAMLVGEGRSYLGLVCVSKEENLETLAARANAQLKEFPGYVRVRHVARVQGPWAVENGLLTPTLKLKRKEAERRFQKEIEEMFAKPPMAVK